jgi:hypothetical protein
MTKKLPLHQLSQLNSFLKTHFTRASSLFLRIYLFHPGSSELAFREQLQGCTLSIISSRLSVCLQVAYEWLLKPQVRGWKLCASASHSTVIFSCWANWVTCSASWINKCASHYPLTSLWFSMSDFIKRYPVLTHRLAVTRHRFVNFFSPSELASKCFSGRFLRLSALDRTQVRW